MPLPVKKTQNAHQVQGPKKSAQVSGGGMDGFGAVVAFGLMSGEGAGGLAAGRAGGVGLAAGGFFATPFGEADAGRGGAEAGVGTRFIPPQWGHLTLFPARSALTRIIC